MKSFKTKDNSFGQTLMLYFGESWNKLDTLCVIMYVTSITLEFYDSKTSLNAARFDFIFLIIFIISFIRAFLAIDVVLWFIRLLVLLMIDRTVGPMLLMIQAMVIRNDAMLCLTFEYFLVE